MPYVNFHSSITNAIMKYMPGYMDAFHINIGILIFCFFQGYSRGDMFSLDASSHNTVISVSDKKISSHEQVYRGEDLVVVSCNSSSSELDESREGKFISFATHELPHETILKLNLEPRNWLRCVSSAPKPIHDDGMEIKKIKRRLIGSGAHRQLQSSITMTLKESKRSEVVFVEKLPSGLFADMFELEDLVAQGAYINASIYGDHNLELPTLRSTESIVVLNINVDRDTRRFDGLVQINATFPLHARYPPLSVDSHISVSLNPPYILHHCLDDEKSLKTAQNVVWSVISWKKTSDLQWAVPAGNPLHSKEVTVITACTALAGVAIVFVVLMKSSYS